MKVAQLFTTILLASLLLFSLRLANGAIDAQIHQTSKVVVFTRQRGFAFEVGSLKPPELLKSQVSTKGASPHPESGLLFFLSRLEVGRHGKFAFFKVEFSDDFHR